MKSFIIAGGTGFIGRHLCDYVAERGGEITVLTRKIDPNLKYRQIEWNPYNHDGSWSKEIDGKDVVINLAGSTISKRWSNSYKKMLEESRIASTSAIVEAINKSGDKPKYLVNASASGYYGDTGPNTVNEEGNHGNDFLAFLSKKWETEANRLNPPVKLMIPRFGVVLGKDGGAFPELIKASKRGISLKNAGESPAKSWIHVDDAVSSIMFMLEHDFTGTYNAVSNSPVSIERLMSLIMTKTNSKPRIKVGPGAVKFLLGEGAVISLFQSQRIIPSVLNRLGFKFKYDDITVAVESLI